MIRLGLAPPRLALLSLDLHCAMQLLPIAIQPLGSSPARSLPKQAFNGLRQQTVCTEIPIASNAPPRHTSRGFLPWRFAYAGPRVRRTTFTGPASATLHTNGHHVPESSTADIGVLAGQATGGRVAGAALMAI